MMFDAARVAFDNQLLRVHQAAREASVHVDTIRRWSDAGLLPATRLPSGERRIRRRDLLALLTPEAAK